MPTRIVVIDGHPDSRRERLCHALAAAYVDGAVGAGHSVRRIVVAETDFPLLRTREAWENGVPAPAIRECQEHIGWAEHLVIV